MLPFILLSLAVTLIVLTITHISIRCTKKARLIDEIPGPKPIPILGNLLQFWGSKEHIWNTFSDLADKYYPTCKIWRANSAIVLIRHPDDFKILLSCKSNITKGHMYKFAKPWLNDGLVMTTGDKWCHRRKLLTSAFHLNNVKNYINTTIIRCEKFIQEMNSFEDGTVHTALPLFPKLMLDIMCSIVGVTIDDIEPEIVREYHTSLDEFGFTCVDRASKPYILDFMVPLLPLGKIVKHSLKIFHSFSERIIETRREFFNRNKIYNQMSNDPNSNSTANANIDSKEEYKISNMLDLLLFLEKEGLIDHEGIKEEMNVLIIGGHETSGTGLAFFMMLLAENSEIQERARAEVSSVLNKTNGKISYADIQKFEYLECCIKESLRMFPSVPVLLRQITKDIQLKTCFLPAGTEVLLHGYKLHRDPNFWPEPNKYDPDRFLPENSVGRHPFSYVPFSAGPRNCIGSKLGLIQMKVVAAAILYNFKLESISSTSDIQFQMHIMLHPNDSLRVKFVKIKM